MHQALAITLIFWIAVVSACIRTAKDQRRRPLTIAAAANVTEVFREIGEAFTRDTGVPVVFSFASTAQLAHQIERGGPFDLFAAADTKHVDELFRKGRLLPDSRAVYAIGRLVLWMRPGSTAAIAKLDDLAKAPVKVIAAANPETAPYGRAAVETLKAAGIWAAVQPKLVYATSVSLAREYAATGNADAAFTAYSLVMRSGGTVITVEERLHSPIEQGLGVVADSTQIEAAQQFRSYLLEGRGRELLLRYGYELPTR